METPTQRQLEALRFINAGEIPPTLSEIATELGINITAARQHVNALVTRGLLKRLPNTARGLVVLDAGRDALGRITMDPR